MKIFYNLTIRLYYFLIYTASFFNKKAKFWIEGRKDFWTKLEDAKIKDTQNIWFHVASLGEFEQGRTVIEAIKKLKPEYKIVLTFFSPSGYEIRKNYDKADYIFYLPLDTKYNAKKFIEIVKPKIVFFVKYEFWYHYLNQLFKSNIETYIFSSIFREKQIFFKPYGKWYRGILKFFKHIFVQNQNSIDLLKTININNTTLSGDTRFDRVFEISQNVKKYPIIEKFIENNLVLICGSTWLPDEEIIINFINNKSKNIKTIIAPHEINQNHVSKLCSLIKNNYIKYSEANLENIVNHEVLIIDNIGMLSSLYQYGNIAYIGGGFGVGIHNTLEAATFGLPIVFGSNYHKFKEAKDLIFSNAAFSISNQNELNEILIKLIEKENLRIEAGKYAKNYIVENKGATQKILEKIEFFNK